MNNPNPITRARRIETRRKELGYSTRCFYCPECDIFCFELDHPVTEDLDEDFKRAVCRNCHRKLEARRDIKGLTKNGQRNVNESELEKLRRYLLLMAEDEDCQAELFERDPNTPVPLIIAASRDRAASLRRKAQTLSLSLDSRFAPMAGVPKKSPGAVQQSDLSVDARQAPRKTRSKQNQS